MITGRFVPGTAVVESVVFLRFRGLGRQGAGAVGGPFESFEFTGLHHHGVLVTICQLLHDPICQC